LTIYAEVEHEEVQLDDHLNEITKILER